MIFHGGGLDKAIENYGGEKSDWLDLSTGINPNPYPVYGVDPLSWARLPDTLAMDTLLAAARNYYGVRKDQNIIAANGTQAIIEILPRIFKAKRVGIISPTYNEHANSWARSGAEIIEIAHGADIPEALDILVLVNPNNPTGEIHDHKYLLALSEKLKETGGILIVDEAFCDTQPEKSITSEQPDNVIVLKSFGKFFGLAGLRLGFAIGAQKLIDKISQQTGPWAVSGPALQIGVRAFADKNWIGYAQTALLALSKQQMKILNECGLEVIGSNPLFLYVQDDRAQKIYLGLAAEHILIRPFPEREKYLRFGICANREQMERLRSALKKVLSDG